MKHSEARLLIGADPRSVPPELAEHLAGCPECAQFQREMTALDTNIHLALEKSPRLPPRPRVAAPRRFTVMSGWALAASVAVASVLAIWALGSNDTLAREVVTHVEYETGSWVPKEPATPQEVRDVLSKAGVAVDMSTDKVVYARSCLIRGHLAPHLVVSTPQGPITVIILPHESVAHRMTFHEDGMTGVLAPAPRGSIAVLAKGDRDIDAVARQLQQSVTWLR